MDTSDWGAVAGFTAGLWGLRFCRWRDRGVWAKLFELLASEHEYKWLVIDATFVKVHPHAAGAAGGNQAMGRKKGG